MTLCPRLHADSVPLRLLVTYAGAGTLYVIDGDVDRSRLLVPPEAAGNDRAVRSGRPLVSADCGDVLLLKGNAWHGNKGKAWNISCQLGLAYHACYCSLSWPELVVVVPAGHGAVHRSPHGISQYSPRLVLTIDCQ